MIEFWRKFHRHFFSYSRSDRNAIIILSASIVLVIILTGILPLLFKPEPRDFSEIKALFEEWEKEQKANNKVPKLVMFDFNPNTIGENQLDSLDLPSFVKRNILSYRDAGGSFKESEDVRRIYGMNDSIFLAIKDYIIIPVAGKTKTKSVVTSEKEPVVPTGTFDPNEVSNEILIEFGFSDYQAINLLAYRESGGKFTVPEELLKIYGIDSGFFQTIRAFIEIEQIDEPADSKISSIERVELNSADTVQLITLPGIGSVYAARIIKYRDLLGGFYSVDQLLEVYNFPSETFEQVSEYVFADTVKLKKLRVNFMDYSDLIRHPYLNKEQVNAILDTRNKNGAFKNLKNIDELEVFDPETFSRIRPYITCR